MHAKNTTYLKKHAENTLDAHQNMLHLENWTKTWTIFMLKMPNACWMLKHDNS